MTIGTRFQRVFGCRHPSYSFPTSRTAQRGRQQLDGMFVVCQKCFQELPYDWNEMRIARTTRLQRPLDVAVRRLMSNAHHDSFEDQVPPVLPKREAVASRTDSNLFLGNSLDAPGGMVSLRKEIARYDISLALDLIVARLAALKNISGAAVALMQEGVMSCVASTGSAPALGTTIDSNAGLSGECIQTKQAISCADTSSDPRVNALVCKQLGLRSLFIMPILRDARVVGLIEIFSPAPSGISSQYRTILEGVAQIVGEATQEKLTSIRHKIRA